MKQKINILIWNTRGLKSKKPELTKRLENIDVALLAETKTQHENTAKVSGFNTLFKPGLGKSGGLAILIRKKLTIEIIKDIKINSSNCEHLGIRITNIIPMINLVLIYRKPYGQESNRVWNEIFNFDYKNCPTIITGDFNARNTGWNCQVTDTNGEYLMETIEDQGFICLNTDTITRIGDINQRDSNLDLILCSQEIPEISEYQIIKDTWGSDHYPLLLDINTEGSTYQKKSNRIANKKTDWGKFTNWLTNKTTQIEEELTKYDEIEEEYERFTKYTKAALFKATNKRKEFKDLKGIR